MTSPRIAIYVRTSTAEKQSTEMQLRELNEYAKIRSWNVFGVYEDAGFSGTNMHRPRLKQLLLDSRSRKFDIVLCWKLDRWGQTDPNQYGRSYQQPVPTDGYGAKVKEIGRAHV